MGYNTLSVYYDDILSVYYDTLSVYYDDILSVYYNTLSVYYDDILSVYYDDILSVYYDTHSVYYIERTLSPTKSTLSLLQNKERERKRERASCTRTHCVKNSLNNFFYSLRIIRTSRLPI